MRSGVTEDGEPGVSLALGGVATQMSANEARSLAFSLLEAVVSAEMDAAVMEWIYSHLEMPADVGEKFFKIILQARAQGHRAACVLTDGTNRYTIDQAKEQGKTLILNSINAKQEAAIATLLIEALGMPAEGVSASIDDLRKLRGMNNAEGSCRIVVVNDESDEASPDAPA